MTTRVVDEPGFAGETEALLARLGPVSPITDYPAVLAARAGPPDPAASGQPEPEVRTADLYLPARHGPVGARRYRQGSAIGPSPVLLWLHGGGFIGGSVNDIDHVCSGLARFAGVTVVSLEYRLAPENPYPAALHDTYDAVQWLAHHGAVLGGDGRLAANSLIAICRRSAAVNAPRPDRAFRRAVVSPWPAAALPAGSVAARSGLFRGLAGAWAEADVMRAPFLTGSATETFEP